MLKKVKTQGLFLLSFLAVSVFLSGCQNQMSCDGISAKNANVQFRLLHNANFVLDLKNSHIVLPVLWNDSVFVLFPTAKTLTVFKLDEKFQPTEWKKFPIKNSPALGYSMANTGVVDNKLFFEYRSGDRNTPLTVRREILLIDESGGLEELNFSQWLKLLPSAGKEENKLLLNVDTRGLSESLTADLFYTVGSLEKTAKPKSVGKKGSLYYIYGINHGIVSGTNDVFFISPLLPGEYNQGLQSSGIDYSALGLYQMNKKTFEIQETKNFKNQHRCFFYANNDENQDKIIIKTNSHILHGAYYDEVEKQLYFSMVTNVLYSNNGLRRLSEHRSHLGFYNMDSGELSFLSQDDSPAYVLGKMNEKMVVYEYVGDVQNNKLTLKFFEITDD